MTLQCQKAGIDVVITLNYELECDIEGLSSNVMPGDKSE